MSIYRFESAGKFLADEFVENEVPKALATLSAEDRKRIENGEGDFPVELIRSVRDGDGEEQQKIYTMMAIAGTWFIAATDSYWSAGQIDGDAYSARVGVVIMIRNPESYSPIHKQMETIVRREQAGSDEWLRTIAAGMTMDARKARKPEAR